jgi:L-threonylcarbamoyladenylate synthase
MAISSAVSSTRQFYPKASVTGVPQAFRTTDGAAAEAGLEAAAAAIAAGELVAMPTETVYGLAADATNPSAVARIFAAKGRPRFNPLIVHLPSLAAAERIAIFTPEARQLAAKFWPGPLTMVLKTAPGAGIADLVTAGLDTVAIRVPAHPIAQALLVKTGKPLAAPSANRSGHVSATSADHVAADLGDEVRVILDAGPARLGIESTILAVTDEGVALLRPGAVARADIESVLGTKLLDPAANNPAAPRAPGMLAQHYAPAAVLRLDARDVRPGEALLAFGLPLPPGSDKAAAVINLSEHGDLVEAAARLFSALRELDRVAGKIAVMLILDEGLGEAINDRLRRGATSPARS